MKKPIYFTKMHGIGNDFVILDSISQNVKITPMLLRRLADRHFGIGCDQILIVEPPLSPEYDFHYRIFNADGKETTQCGNGARCFGKYVYESGLIDKSLLNVSTLSGGITIDVSDPSCIKVGLSPPQFSPKPIPLNIKKIDTLPKKGRYKLPLLNGEKEVTILSVGNPHCVISVPGISEAPVIEIGQALQNHPAFPKGINVTFMQVLARNHIRCRVFERGVGETLACGTAACAAVISGILQEELSQEVQVDMKGGRLSVAWEPEGPVFLSGPAVGVFCGEFCINYQEENR